jgi:succinoglycan biosynthesis transport protein ExoP
MKSKPDAGTGTRRRSPATLSAIDEAHAISDGHMDLVQFLAAIRKRWALVIAPVVLSAAGLALYFVYAPKEYTATAQILIDIQRPRIIGSDAVAPGLDTSRYMIGPVIDSQVEILQSTRIAERVVRATGLQDDPAFASDQGLLERILGDVFPATVGTDGVVPAGPDAGLLAATGKFQRQLDVRRKGLTLILLVRFTDEDPARAARIANATTLEYLDDQRESRREAARQTNEWLNSQVAELREQVAAGEQRLQEYSAANDLVSVGGLTVSEREIAETVTQLIVARTEGASKRAELQQVEALASDPDAATSISRVLESQVVRDLRRQESEVMRKLAAATNQFGEHDTQAEMARAELRNVRSEILREIQRIIQNARNDYEISKSRIRFLEENLRQMTEKFGERNKLSLIQSQLEREVKTTRDLYLSLLSRLKETRVQESLLYPDARVIDAATVPRQPAGPRKLVLLALALFGGLGVGITLATLREHVARTPRGH